MTLKEAIAHAETQAIRDEKEAERKRKYGGEFYDSEVKACLICAEQHRKLAVWLKELDQRRQQSEQKWIPVGERLPEDRDWYLGIFKEPDTGWINPLPYVCDYAGMVTQGTTYEGWILHNCTDQDSPLGYYKGLQCVAWMPLPDPYEAEAERRTDA